MNRKAQQRRAALSVGAAIASATLFVSLAEAHTIGLSTGEYTASDTTLDVKLAFARGEAARLAPLLDVDGDGHVSAVEVRGAGPQLASRIVSAVQVRMAGEACQGKLLDAALTEVDGLEIDARYFCAAPAESEAGFEIDLAALLGETTRGHRHVARVKADVTRDEVLSQEQSVLSVPRSPSVERRPPDETLSPAPASSPRTLWSFVGMGVEHISTGYDHLVFLVGLVLARTRLRSLLAVITAFTVAHSLTLALSVLDVWSPSPAIVEPAIALSIVYVGAENFFVRDGSKRWRVTFPFGLVHGFGFAGGLRAVGLPRQELAAALASFNLGVEVGQVLVLSLLLPIVWAVRDRPWFERRAVRILSGAVAGAGGIWFISRIVNG